MKPKMTPDDVKQAMKLIKAGEASQADIVRMFKVSRQYVSQLCERHGIDTRAARQKFERKLDKEQLKKLRVKIS